METKRKRGRPTGQVYGTPLTVRLDDGTMHDLDAVSEASGIPRSRWIREALKRAIRYARRKRA